MAILNYPCNDNGEANLPGKIGSNYYCESGNSGSNKNALFPDDLLWDGKDCGNDEGDCRNSTQLMPWLTRVFDKAINDDIEVRLCGHDEPDDDEVPISIIELDTIIDTLYTVINFRY